MFLKVATHSKLVLLFFASILTACSSYDVGRQKIQNQHPYEQLSGSFALVQQVAPPPEVQSIQLYPQGRETAPPIIKLNGAQPLVLEFDYLDAGIQQFKLTVSHRTKDWEESPIGPTIYLDSFFETFFGDGRKSFVQQPTYHHYSYTFPNKQLNITKSGNYLLSIFDNDTNTLLFKIPFFISEEAGTLETRIEQLFAQRNDARILAQPFSKYRYPGFVQQPQFDLSFIYVQNQFWGRSRETDLFDTATPGVVNFHLGRDKSFIADYEFNLLDILSFRADGRQIIGFQPGKEPPVVTLRRDIQRFDAVPDRYPGPALGLPIDDRQAKYGNIQFSLETVAEIATDARIYLIGDFNHWMVNPQNRMRYDSTSAVWQGQALVKQGVYGYKYILIEENSIDDLLLDQVLTESQQEYITFVYFRDPRRNFDRLLKVDITEAR